MEFKELTNQDAKVSMAQELEKLLNTGPEEHRHEIRREFDGFQQLFDRFVSEPGPSIYWDKIEKLPRDSIRSYSDLPNNTSKLEIKTMLDQLVVIKLNGALATPIGCSGPTSTIPVRNNLTSLDMTVQQIEHLNKTYNTDVPLVLMNSFLTDEDTMKIIRKYSGFKVSIKTFNQSCFPRINKESLMPIARSCNPDENVEAWYPPGHGDFYQAFAKSGLLDEFVNKGRKFCFISNTDNLGATVDLNILNMCLNGQEEFIMEVTDKTRADVKGGTLIHYEGKLRLLEVAQVPKDQLEDFMSVKKFNVFNTNNLWISMPAIQRIMKNDLLDMEIIVNPLTLEQGTNVYQLVTAIGAAMKCFDNAVGLNVPRSRFLPVKKTSDLLLVMSNLYTLDHGALLMSPKRMFPSTPLVKLGNKHFKIFSEYLSRFGSIPDLLELDHLTVSGDVTFGKGVSLKGTVIIIANHGDRIDIPAGSILENKIVSGNLRIMDH
eukprot:GFUD01013858.1.p1 GENE.GFUD01013858.1~~GFUD01013858.1.p1  ORF type:complete len:508 (+),score=151.30 GFUD01013858.1:63-1526(+)